MYTDLADIDESDHQTKKDVLCAITTQKTVSFGTNNSGKLLTGVCEDDTDCITYCAWHENAKQLKDKLHVGQAYMLQNVTVSVCKAKFALTPRKLQLIIDDKSIVTPSNENKRYRSPLSLVPIKDVAPISNGETKCNIAGTITEKYWQDTDREDGQRNHLKVKIRDSDADIDVSFYRDVAHNFHGEIGSILLLRNTTAKAFGSYHVIQGNIGTHSINPSFPELRKLSHLHIGPEAGIHMSPKKKDAQKTTINELHQRSGKQSFQAMAVDLHVKTYPKCPLVGCRKSLYYNENANTYTCDSYVKKYHVSSKGLTVTVTVEDDGTTKDITLFNETAEKFLQTTDDNIHENTELLLSKVKGNRYLFVVTAGKLKDEFVCLSSTLIDSTHSEPMDKTGDSTEHQVSDGNNNECHPPSRRESPKYNDYNSQTPIKPKCTNNQVSTKELIKQKLQFGSNTPDTDKPSQFIRTVTPDNYGDTFVDVSSKHRSVDNDLDYQFSNTNQTYLQVPEPFSSHLPYNPTTFRQEKYDSQAPMSSIHSSSTHKMYNEEFNPADCLKCEQESPIDLSCDKQANMPLSFIQPPTLFGLETPCSPPRFSGEEYYEARIMPPLYTDMSQKRNVGLTEHTTDHKHDSFLQQATPKKKGKFLSIQDML